MEYSYFNLQIQYTCIFDYDNAQSSDYKKTVKHQITKQFKSQETCSHHRVSDKVCQGQTIFYIRIGSMKKDIVTVPKLKLTLLIAEISAISFVRF